VAVSAVTHNGYFPAHTYDANDSYHVDAETAPQFANQAYWNDAVTPSQPTEPTKPLSYTAWNSAMKNIYGQLHISYKKTTHVFRASGS
jgi:hypothetical protein